MRRLRVLIVLTIMLLALLFGLLAPPVLAQAETPAFEEGLFIDLVIRLLEGGVAGVIVYWFLEQPFISGFVKWLEQISTLFTFTAAELKRYAAIGLSTIVSLALYMILVLVEVAALPMDWVAWVDLILWLGGLSYGVSQVVHARRKLSA